MDRDQGSPGFKRFLVDRRVLPSDQDNPPNAGLYLAHHPQYDHLTHRPQPMASNMSAGAAAPSSSRHPDPRFHAPSHHPETPHAQQQYQHPATSSSTRAFTSSSSAHSGPHRERLYGPVPAESQTGSGSGDSAIAKRRKGKRKETVFQCEYCKQLFGRRHHKERHVDNIHIQTKGPTCKVCGASFHQKPNLARHLKLKHQQNLYSCEECGLSFSRKDLLKKHRQETHFALGQAGPAPSS